MHCGSCVRIEPGRQVDRGCEPEADGARTFAPALGAPPAPAPDEPERSCAGQHHDERERRDALGLVEELARERPEEHAEQQVQLHEDGRSDEERRQRATG